MAELQAELAAEVEKFNHISADLERIMVDDMAAALCGEANGTIERLQLELSEAKQTSSSSGIVSLSSKKCNACKTSSRLRSRSLMS